MNKTIYTCKLLLLFLVILTHQSIAQTSTSWTGATSASWSTASNWTNGIPDSTKDVYVGNSYFTGSYQPKISVSSSCNSITIGGDVVSVVDINQNLKVFGNLTISNDGAITHTTGYLYLKGNWSNNGMYQTTTNSKVILNGGLQVVGGDSVTTFRKLTVNAGSIMTLSNNVKVTESSCLLSVYGEINPGMSPSYKVTADLIRVFGGAKLKVNAATISDNYLTPTLSLWSGSIVDYSSTVTNQTVSSAYLYSTLMISGSGVKSLTANLPALYSRAADAGKIIIDGGTFDMGIYTASRGTYVAGGEISMANGALLKLSGSNNFPKNFASVSLNQGSTVHYYGAAQTINSNTYGNLILEGAGTKSASSDFSVAGDFTIQSGTLNTGATTMNISVKGSFIMNGGSISGTNATYIMSGSSNQYVNLLSSLVNLKVSKTSGNVILSSDVTVTNNLNFSSGIIQTDNNYLILPNGSTVTGASQATGWVNGNIKTQFISGSSVTKNFDFGTASYYAPATIVFSSIATGGYLTGAVVGSDHPELNYSGVDPLKSINDYWSFNNEGISFTSADLTLSWNTADADAGINPNNMLFCKFDGTAWSKYSISTEVANSVTISNLTDVEDFAIGQKISQYHWTGDAYTTDWFTPKNWYGGIPDSSCEVSIPNPLGSRRNYPTLIATQTGQVGNLTVESDGTLIIDGGTLKICGNASNQGVFDATNGTVEFAGTSGDQTVADGLFYQNKIKNLIISNNVTLAGTDSITGTLTVNDGKTLSTNNNLVLKSDVNGTARIAELPTDGSGRANAFIEGRVCIERYIPARKAWRLLSSPVKSASAPTICASWQENAYGSSFTSNLSSSSNLVSNPNPVHSGVHIFGGSTANGFDQSLTNLPSLKYYDNTTNTFTGIPANPGTFRPITDYNGYMIYIRGDRSIDLNLGNATPVTTTTLRIKGEVITGNHTTNVNAQRFTVFGNPYASPINFGTIDKNNVKNSFYIWDPRLAGTNGLGAYVTVSYNSSTGTYDVTSSASAISQYIPSGEAVLVESADGTRPGTLTVKESDKTSNGSDMLFGRTNTIAKIVRTNLFERQADGNYGLLDGSMTSYHDNNSSAYDNNDVSKLSADGESIALSRDNHTLAIERRKTISGADTSFISLAKLSRKQYRLEIVAENMQHENLTAVVIDKYASGTKSTVVDLNGSTFVDFSVTDDPASFAADRFLIVFNSSPKIPVNTTVISNIEEKKSVKAEQASEAVVYPNPVTGNDINISLTHLVSGNYTVKIYSVIGQLVAAKPVRINSASGNVKLSVPAGFAPGKYEVKIEGEGKVINTSLIKQ